MIFLLFKRFSILFIVKKALPVLCPYFPSTYLIDVSFKQQMSILMQAYAGNHEQPSLATWTQQQTVSRQLNCHFNLVSVSESSKAWISNSDRAATNQNVIVSLLQGKLGYIVRSAGLAFSSQKWSGEGVDDIVELPYLMTEWLGGKVIWSYISILWQAASIKPLKE